MGEEEAVAEEEEEVVVVVGWGGGEQAVASIFCDEKTLLGSHRSGISRHRVSCCFPSPFFVSQVLNDRAMLSMFC